MNRFVLATASIAAAVALAACGSSSPSSTPTPSVGMESSATAPPVGATVTAGATASVTPAQNDKITRISGITPAQAADVIATTVTGSRPLLFPNAIADNWRADLTGLNRDTFTVQFTSPDSKKSVLLALVAANPQPPTGSSAQQHPGFHGDSQSLYQVQDKNNPASFRYLVWNETGTWGENPASGTVPYYLSASGLTDAEFWNIANSLHPIQR